MRQKCFLLLSHSQKVKPIFWLSIWDGFFKVSFHFSEKMREELVTLSL
ncbi:DUF3788 family protein, partial [Enterococcus durans]